MRKIAIIFSIVVASAMIFSACGKYEEGPSISLLTKTARITGTWTLTEVTVNGTVQDMQGLVITSTMEKDGTGSNSLTYGGLSATTDLEWEFNAEKTHLRTRQKEIDATVFDEWMESEIIKLTNSECWLREVETENSITTTTITKLTKN